MQSSLMGATNPAFVAYAITCIVLCLNLLLLWVSSGTSRARSGVAINPEDGARYNAPVADIDPPAVARILRAHRNAEATTYPFLLLGLVYVLAGATVWVATSIFIVFAVARIAHSIFYVRAVQPWRTIAFVISLLAILALIAALVLALLKA